jgi:murein DD-endopeptidase MepM/ murein hydrolase activator NlpD
MLVVKKGGSRMTLSFSWFRNPIWFVRLFVASTVLVLLLSFFSYRQLRRRLGFASPTALMRSISRDSEITAVPEVEPVFDPVNRNRAHLESVCRVDRVAAVGLQAVVKKQRLLAHKKKIRRRVVKKQHVPHAHAVPHIVSTTHNQRNRSSRSGSLAGYAGSFSLPIRRDQYYISSPFGWRRRTRSFHEGIDMCACRGTPVMAAAEGVVVFAGNAGGFGNLVIIEHDEHCRTRYGHLSAIKTHVGAQVAVGKIIGLVGATGHVVKRRGGDGSHLHFGVYIDGRPVNPFHFLS